MYVCLCACNCPKPAAYVLHYCDKKLNESQFEEVLPNWGKKRRWYGGASRIGLVSSVREEGQLLHLEGGPKSEREDSVDLARHASV